MISQLTPHLARVVIDERLQTARDQRSRPAHTYCPSSTRLSAALLPAALVAVLLAGCGGDRALEPTGRSSSQPPTTAVQQSPSTVPQTEAQLDVEPDPDAPDAVPEPERPVEPDSEVTPSYDAAPDREPTGEAESDASRWVDQRQEKVIEDVNENNMDAIEAWTP